MVSRIRARSRAYWAHDDFGQDFEYEIPGTPCNAVVNGQTCHHADDLQALFPADTWLVAGGAASRSTSASAMRNGRVAARRMGSLGAKDRSDPSLTNRPFARADLPRCGAIRYVASIASRRRMWTPSFSKARILSGAIAESIAASWTTRPASR